MNKPLSLLDTIHADDSLKEKTLRRVMSPKKNNQKIVIPIIVSLACIIMLFVIPITNQETNKEIMAYVSIDINPSFELLLNKDDKIVDINSFNEDAKEILDNVSLKGKTLSDGLSLLLTDNQYSTYLQKGILEISIYSKKPDISTRLESEINLHLSKHNVKQYHCGVVNEDTYNAASTHHMSAAKYSIIETILNTSPDYSIEQLQKMNMKELYSILNKIDSNNLPNQRKQHRKHH